ncbi:hypothetical protein ACU8KH_02631 [Lachancea thermotolerans]
MHNIDPYEWQLDQALLANASQAAPAGAGAWSDRAMLERSTSAEPLPKLAPLAAPASEGSKRALEYDGRQEAPSVTPGKRTRRGSQGDT